MANGAMSTPELNIDTGGSTKSIDAPVSLKNSGAVLFNQQEEQRTHNAEEMKVEAVLIKCLIYALILYFAVSTDLPEEFTDEAGILPTITFNVLVFLTLIFFITWVLGYEDATATLFGIAVITVASCIIVQSFIYFYLYYQFIHPKSAISPLAFRIIQIVLFYAMMTLLPILSANSSS
jgi:hypothetical protein